MAEPDPVQQWVSVLRAGDSVELPAALVASAGLRHGERVIARVTGPGAIVVAREVDATTEFAGTLTGVFRSPRPNRVGSPWR
ncbi:MAG TPA: hypothetical protein VGQ20_13215 [Acidimicrobiales bacterium]|jgi:antitoxin component of MazEF toxin-antitoxin module|nr:hypothetical protein [Acidimicrobiales bacterium]